LAHIVIIASTYFVSLMSGSGGDLALLARCKLRQITMVVTLPVMQSILVYDPPRLRS
jgi:hypothetical protein